MILSGGAWRFVEWWNESYAEERMRLACGWNLIQCVCVCAAVCFFCYLVAVVWFNVYDNWCIMFDNCQIGRWKLSMILLGRQRKLWNVDTKAKVLAKNKINFEGCTSFDNFLILFLTKKLKNFLLCFNSSKRQHCSTKRCICQHCRLIDQTKCTPSLDLWDLTHFPKPRKKNNTTK